MRIVAAALLAAAGGCAPNVVSYYRPTAEGGKAVAERCAPVESGIDLQIGLMPVRARVSGGDARPHVLLILSRLPWQTIQFSSGAFRIRDLRDNGISEPRAIEVFRDDGVKSLTLPFPQPGRAPAAKVPKTFWVHLYLPQPVPNDFELLGPPVLVDGAENAFPPIRFERRRWTGISPLNC